MITPIINPSRMRHKCGIRHSFCQWISLLTLQQGNVQTLEGISKGYLNIQIFPIFSGPFSFFTTHTILPALHSISFQSSFPSFSSCSHLPLPIYIYIYILHLRIHLPFWLSITYILSHMKPLSLFTLFLHKY